MLLKFISEGNAVRFVDIMIPQCTNVRDFTKSYQDIFSHSLAQSPQSCDSSDTDTPSKDATLLAPEKGLHGVYTSFDLVW